MAAPAPSPTVRAKLEQVRRSLLDLSRRNRLLNYRPTGHGALPITDERPDQIYALLVEAGATLQFLPVAPPREESTPPQEEAETSAVPEAVSEPPAVEPAPEPLATPQPPAEPVAAVEAESGAASPVPPSAGPTPETDAEPGGVDHPADLGGAPPAVPADALPDDASPPADSATPADAPPELAPHHTDRFLQTSLTEAALQDRLLRLWRQAESALQEQGSNILYLALGLVEWTDADSTTSRAPLLLIPVELNRRSVRGRHTLKHTGEDPVVNPALAELCRRTFGVELPSLDPDAEDPIGALFAAVAEAIEPLRGWRLLPEIHLGLFSFAKLLMYLDLDDARWPAEAPVTAGPIIRSLLGEPVESDATLPPLPTNLDDLDPAQVFQVVDADSSQQAAVVAAKSGRSLVIEGPPGTGKSQTITNIIAECLAAGRTVLFVAEKAAALEVVKSRLERVGLGDFVAELHSRHASKRAFMEDLQRTLARAHEPPTKRELVGAAHLAELRSRLNAYVNALHEPQAPLSLTPYAAIGRAVALADAPEAPFDLPDVLEWDAARLRAAEEAVTALAHAADRTGDPATHPWRGAGLTDLPLTARQQLPGRLRAAAEAAAAAASTAADLHTRLSLRPPANLAEADAIIALAREILDDPRIDPAHARNPAWDSIPAEIHAALEAGRRLARIRSELVPRWADPDNDTDWTLLAQRRATPPGWLGRLLSPQWRADTGLLRGYLKPGVNPNDPQIALDLNRLVEGRRLRESLDAVGARARELLGDLWQGPRTDWDAVERYARAAARLRSILSRGLGDAAAVERLATDDGRAALRELTQRLADHLTTLRSAFGDVRATLHADPAPFLGSSEDTTPWEAWQARLGECLASPESLDDWAARNRARAQAASAGLLPFLTWLDTTQAAAPSDLPRAFLRQFYRLWLDAVIRARPALAEFRGEDHERIIEKFRDLDRQWLEVSRQRLCAQVHERRPRIGFATSESSGLGILEREIRRKRGIKPIRQLLASPAGPAVQRIKPCFMMSPLSVAQFIEPGALMFDTVIFDEASQVEPADALGAIARLRPGGQLILVGDEKQLPPTNFFAAVGAATAENGDAADDLASASDLESILGLGQAAIRDRFRLRWHYRSRHQSLIDFSNREFYESDLRVFPSPQRAIASTSAAAASGNGAPPPVTTEPELGLSFRYIENAVYHRGGRSGPAQTNPAEARAVAEAVLAHAREHPELSLGVAALSVRQQNAIEDEIERLRRERNDPRVEAFFSGAREEPFFVKNLETVQGDERDVIFISIGYGRDDEGRMTMNFGPINQDGGWRRLNVLTTRARRRCVVFSSITDADIRADESSPRGVRALRGYLAFARAGGVLPRDASAQRDTNDALVPAAVADRLRAMGWDVDLHVGSAGFCVDLAVVDPASGGRRYLAGVECDGDTYRAAATARDRDRLRPSVLEGLGWRLCRLWSPDLLAQPDTTVARLHDRLTRSARQHPAPRSDPAPSPAPTPLRVRQATDGRRAAVDTDNDAPAVPPGFTPYKRYAPSRRARPRPPHEMTEHGLASMLADIVAVEGPIHRDELFRVCARSLDARLTAANVAALEAALAAAIRRDQIAQHGGDTEFLWPPSMREPPLRWRGGDEAVTDPALIAPEEVARVAAWVARNEFGVPEADLPAATVRAMGFRRVTEPLLALGRAGVALAVQSGLIARDARGIMVPAAAASPPAAAGPPAPPPAPAPS